MARAKPRKPEEWRKILEELESSGLTQKAYAKQLGCHPSNFGWWRKRLQELNNGHIDKVEPTFIELRSQNGIRDCQRVERQQVSITSVDGIVVTFASLPPADYIARLLRRN